jgi:hypothetical protein
MITATINCRDTLIAIGCANDVGTPHSFAECDFGLHDPYEVCLLWEVSDSAPPVTRIILKPDGTWYATIEMLTCGDEVQS